MKTVLALSIALFAACMTDHTTSGSQNNTSTGQACHSNADCPSNEICILSSTTAGTPSTVPVGVCHIPVDPLPCVSDANCPAGDVCVFSSTGGTPSTTGGGGHGYCEPGPTTNSCSAGVPCPSGERCNPICSTTGVHYECQPDGIATQQCPLPCVTANDCPTATDRCLPRCATTGGTVCGIPSSPTATCL